MRRNYTLLSAINAISNDGIPRTYSDTFSSKNEYWIVVINNCRQSRSAEFKPRSFTGKERDEETGYSYFSARYMDHEILTSFLSVDRYADKYPSISPYAYCVWNPIKLIDPSGDTIVLKGDAKQINKALAQIREKSENLYFSIDDGGRLNATQRGNKELTKEDKYMLDIINSDNVNINLRVKDNDYVANGYLIDEGGGAYCGNILQYNDNGEVIGATALQAVNVNKISELDRLTWSTGELIWHEISEAYEGGLIAIENKMQSPPSNKLGTTYDDAHCAASNHFLGDVIVDYRGYLPIARLYNKCKRGNK